MTGMERWQTAYGVIDLGAFTEGLAIFSLGKLVEQLLST